MSLSIENAARLVLVDDFQGFASIGHSAGYGVAKRGVDLMGGVMGVMVLVPVTAVVKMMMVATGDFGPVFYAQERIGKDGKVFKLYKYRSMRVGADAELRRMLRKDREMAREYREMRKLTEDPRITKVGKFLRKTSLDELPQVINILKGEMAIVGCRPFLPRERRSMLSYYDDIITVKPGLTGFWQASLRSRGTFKERLKMERYYANNCSLGFDLRILWLTVKTVLSREGAE